MSAATKKIRASVFARAGGFCEAGCGCWVGEDGAEGHLDHAFGRAKVTQSVENCWGLCVPCDTNKTLNCPDAATWLQQFMLHAKRHGYTAEFELAATKLSTLAAKGRAYTTHCVGRF